jgi:hypothetical protein
MTINTQSIYLLIFGCITYLIITDENIAGLINYSCRRVRLHYEKIKWIILNDPRNPIVKYLIYKKSLRMAEQLIKEFENKRDNEI